MEYNKIEITFVAQTDKEADETEVRNLDELELALVGGGSGDVVFS